MDIIIHVGLHKTGTSFLQKEIFPKLEGVNYQIFSENNDFTLKNNEINLISWESLSGNPLSNTRFGAIERRALAYGLKKMYPKAKIIVGFRDKKKWLKSLYIQSIKQGNLAVSYGTWFENFDTKYLDFKGYEVLLKELFDDVYVYQLEDLKEDSDKFVGDLCRFIGVNPPNFKNSKVNKSWKGPKLVIGKLRSIIFIGTRKLLERI